MMNLKSLSLLLLSLFFLTSCIASHHAIAEEVRTQNSISANPTAKELCQFYEKKVQATAQKSDRFAEQIVQFCQNYTPQKLQDKNRPTYNFRPTFCELNQDERTCTLFRAGQIAPKELTKETKDIYSSYVLGFSPDRLRRDYSIDDVVDIRFDPKYKSFEDTFNNQLPVIPVSSGEAKYDYAVEKKMVEDEGLKSLYAPTVPEFEHFVGNYVPRLDSGKGSKPFVCRLPKGIPNGAKPHWLNESDKWLAMGEAVLQQKKIEPLLLSADPECRDLEAKYGKAQVQSWLAEVRRVSNFANQVLLHYAEILEQLDRAHVRTVYHCSSGTDRVGRLSAILQARALRLTEDELRAYQGPGSDSKVDWIMINYLESQLAKPNNESDLQYRYYFSWRKDYKKTPLYLAIQKPDENLHFPALDQLILNIRR